MKKRNVIALSILGVIIIALGFFATPLMRHARARTWDMWVIITARVFGIKGIDISEDALATTERLTMENIRLKAELSDYRHLKDQLGAPVFDGFQKIPAQVIARPIDTLNSSYVINKGVADGVPSGAPVVIRGSILLGFTRELSEHSAIVQTLFHPSTSLTVETARHEEEDPARGLLVSRYQTSLAMETIPRDALLKEGQYIITSAKGSEVPYGMIIGTVASILRPENEAYQTAVVDVPYDADEIDALTVLSLP
jgi:rod shape-determining protein MreC